MIYLLLFLEFAKIGLFTFGGGYAMIPLITEVLDRHDWATTEQLTNMLAISESTPGPFAINMATFIGFEQAGPLGAICSTAGVVLPSFIIILIIAIFISKINMKHPLVRGTFATIRPIVIAAIGTAFIGLITKNLLDGYEIRHLLKKEWPSPSEFDFLGIAIASIVAALLFLVKKISMTMIIGISAALGLIGNAILFFFV